MAFIPFALEEWQSLYEQSVEINLADSGVHPVTLRELVELGLPLDALLDLPLHYPEVNGTRQLRERIAALYEGISADQVLVTVGAAEANAIAVETLLDEGDAVVLMTPSYAQVEGIARNRGCEVVTFPLDPAAGWRPDLDALDAAAGPHVRLIAITNPNNPTGYVLSEAEMQRVVAIAEASGAWLLVDEVYRGSERLGDEETPTFVGRYERVVSINSLSKSYGLSGLRLGWIVAPAVAVENLWRRHEYATIAASAPSMLLAEHALEPGIRAALLRRNRGIVRASYDQLAGLGRPQRRPRLGRAAAGDRARVRTRALGRAVDRRRPADPPRGVRARRARRVLRARRSPAHHARAGPRAAGRGARAHRPQPGALAGTPWTGRPRRC